MNSLHSYASSDLDTLVARLTIIGGIVAVPALIVMALLLRFLAKRPTLWDSPLPEVDFSFPSGHAMISMALTAALLLLNWPTKLRWLALIASIPCVIGIGLSRLYLGVHYPSDILAGWCAALLWVVGVYIILSKWLAKGESALMHEK